MIRRTLLRNNLRLFGTSARRLNANPFLYIKDFVTLNTKINDNLLSLKNPNDDLIIQAIKACNDLQKDIHDYDKFWQDPTNEKLSKKISEILFNENITFDKELLTKILLLKLPIVINIKVLQVFYERNPSSHIDKSIALIPFRHSIFNGDLKNSLKIIDLTTGHPNYINYRNDQLKSGFSKLMLTAAGITLFSKVGVQQIIDLGYLSSSWRHLGSINSMILTYLLNSSFFITIVKFGRTLKSSGGDFLTWQKGTFYNHWFKHSDEMLMCSKLMEADFKLNNYTENSPELVEELCREDINVSGGGSVLKPGLTRDGHKVRLLAPKDNIEDLKLQAYWMSGGDGFEWVEPDQDPAELIWRKHLDKFNKPGLNTGDSTKKLKWAEELIDEKKN